jgi:hypothetical protein
MNRKKLATSHATDDRDAVNLDAFLHPANAFTHPSEILNDPDLTLNEKRAILASWASDACAIEAVPALRQNSTGHRVTFDEVMDALRALDSQARPSRSGLNKHERRRRWFAKRRDGGEGTRLQ